MARKEQIAVYLSRYEAEVVEELAAECSDNVNRAAFLRYALVMGAYLARKALQEIKPRSLALLTVKTLLQTKTGRSLIQVTELGEDEDLSG